MTYDLDFSNQLSLLDDEVGLHVKELNQKNEAKQFILNVHYAKRMPSISYVYGLYDATELIGVCSFGSPASHSLCIGVAGEENASLVIELNRLVLKYNRKNEASFLVGRSLRLLPKPKIVVSYADTAQDHVGIVYQATNFLFTGTTKERTDMAGAAGKHSRHHLGDRTQRQFRSSKHRYVYICADKKTRRRLLGKLNYEIMDYPKT